MVEATTLVKDYIYWFSKLEEPFRSVAIKTTRPSKKGCYLACMSEALGDAFNWSESEEIDGGAWNKLFEDYRHLELTTPCIHCGVLKIGHSFSTHRCFEEFVLPTGVKKRVLRDTTFTLEYELDEKSLIIRQIKNEIKVGS